MEQVCSKLEDMNGRLASVETFQDCIGVIAVEKAKVCATLTVSETTVDECFDFLLLVDTFQEYEGTSSFGYAQLLQHYPRPQTLTTLRTLLREVLVNQPLKSLP